MNWLPAPTHPGLWWVYQPGSLRPEIVDVIGLEEWSGVDTLGIEDRIPLRDFHPTCRWLPVQVPAPPQ